MNRRILALRDAALAFVLICAAIAIGRSVHGLDFALAITMKVLFIFVSVVLLVRAFRRRDLGVLSRGPLALLPKRWQQWCLGEREQSNRSDPS